MDPASLQHPESRIATAPLTVAYVANRFPRWGGGWVLNEVKGVAGAGVELVLYSFKPPLENVAAETGMKEWIDRTIYVPGGFSLACASAALACLVRSPLGFLRA